jgi:hypothetical protein
MMPHAITSFMKSLLLVSVVAVLTTPADGQHRQVIGYAGVLGEWELSATVTGKTSWLTTDFLGPLTMTHVGLCAQDGPEQKTGEIRLVVSKIFSSVKATLLVDGMECLYSARLSHAYEGLLACPGRQPVPLSLWLK